VFYPRNPRAYSLYGYSPVEQILFSMNLFIRRQVSQLQFYTESNQPKGFLMMPPEWSGEDQLRQFQNMLNALISGNMPEMQRIMVAPGGSKYEDIKREPLTDQFDQWLAQVSCFAFGVSPMPFLFMKTNRATAESARQQALQEGLGPFIRWVEGFLTHLVNAVWGWRDIEATSRDDSMVDPKTKLAIHQGYMEMGVLSVNDVRTDLARALIKGGDRYYRTVGNQLVLVGHEDEVFGPQQPAPMPGQRTGRQTTNVDSSGGQEINALWKRNATLKQRELSQVLDYL